MRRTIGIVGLTLACVGLALVMVWRWQFQRLEQRYPAALYFAQIRAVDDETSEPVDFEIHWDYEVITPFSKGAGPEKIVTHKDKSVIVALVGLDRKEGLPLKLEAEGYLPKLIWIWSSRYSGQPEMEEVRLRRSKAR